MEIVTSLWQVLALHSMESVSPTVLVEMSMSLIGSTATISAEGEREKGERVRGRESEGEEGQGESEGQADRMRGMCECERVRKCIHLV